MDIRGSQGDIRTNIQGTSYPEREPLSEYHDLSIFDVIYNLGQYNYQKADDKAFTFFGSYTAQKYKAYFSTGVNNLTSYENGGIIDKEDLEIYETREVPVNMGALNLSKSILKNRNILLVQRYKIGGQAQEQDTSKSRKSGLSGLSGTLSHIFIWENNNRRYFDNAPPIGVLRYCIYQ
jgi:hypothetical protein